MRSFSLPLWFTAPFFCTLIIWAYLPYTRTPVVTLWDIPVKGPDVCLFILLFTFGWATFISPYRNAKVRASCKSLVVWLLTALVYAALTMLWSEMDTRNTLAMGYTLCSAAACFLVPYFAYLTMSSAQVRGVLWLLSGLLAVVSLSYFIQAFFGLQFRTRNDYEVITFGMARVAGPLLYPAKSHFQLLPAAAFILSELVARRVRAVVATPLIIMILLALLGSGSRAAVISLAIFVVLVGISLRGISKAIVIAVILTVCAGIVAVLSIQAKADRLLSSDRMREQTYATSLAIISNQTPIRRVFGDGYGRWWPWYIADVEDGGALVTGRFVQRTDYGLTLYNPHSVLLLSWVELGAVGLFLFVGLMIFLAKQGLQARSQPHLAPLMCSLAALVPAFAFDCVIVADIKLNLVFWCFVLGTCVLRTADSNGIDKGHQPSFQWTPGLSRQLHPIAAIQTGNHIVGAL